MRKLYLLFTISGLLLISFQGYVQEADNDEFKPNGKPILKVFTNFHAGLSDSINDAAFEIRRAYLGYQYFLSPKFEMAVKLDIGGPNDASEFSLNRRFAYFKNAYLRFTHKKLTTQFGIIDVYMFLYHEKYWAHRYIWKSFMDRYRFGPKADLGWNIAYKFSDVISADFGIYNGEGYSKIQTDNAFRPALGVSIFPVKGLMVRLYGDFILKGVYQSTIAAFLGYKFKDKFIGGLEYNYQFNYSYQDGNDRYGYSIYGSYYITKQWQIFARFDQLASNIPPDLEERWGLSVDGSALIGGVEYSPIRKVKIALNYQGWYPYSSDILDRPYIFLNFEFKL